eukprot:TRINITY_DN25234_c0_g1_i1.p1 TRINITY_DN25234_c0_g1~~TRINITY_DN25234_c0_g1_i1.p1  ORF type:complete len:381 (+),score=71.98 TRINITY_DN25234_c0_g1_i1:1154-2296(+)
MSVHNYNVRKQICKTISNPDPSRSTLNANGGGIHMLFEDKKVLVGETFGSEIFLSILYTVQGYCELSVILRRESKEEVGFYSQFHFKSVESFHHHFRDLDHLFEVFHVALSTPNPSEIYLQNGDQLHIPVWEANRYIGYLTLTQANYFHNNPSYPTIHLSVPEKRIFVLMSNLDRNTLLPDNPALDKLYSLFLHHLLALKTENSIFHFLICSDKTTEREKRIEDLQRLLSSQTSSADVFLKNISIWMDQSESIELDEIVLGEYNGVAHVVVWSASCFVPPPMMQDTVKLTKFFDDKLKEIMNTFQLLNTQNVAIYNNREVQTHNRRKSLSFTPSSRRNGHSVFSPSPKLANLQPINQDLALLSQILVKSIFQFQNEQDKR